MATREDIRRYVANLRGELDSAYLYDHMALAEKDPRLAEVYRRLAETERRHARLWAQRLEEAGVKVEHRPGWRVRLLAWLARRLGPHTVLPMLVQMEREARTEYDTQPEAVAAGLPAQERSHARVFKYLAQLPGGLPGSALARLEGRHRAIGGNALRAGVLGANDGLVSNLSLVMGVAGAALSNQFILIAGLAGMLAGAFSMAIGEWISVQSAREMFHNQIRIEKEEIEAFPEEEAEELALIYQAKGIPPEEARRTARRLMQDPQMALDTLAREELGIDPAELGGSPWEASLASFTLFALGAVIPVVPFFFTGGLRGLVWSALLGALALFGMGSLITVLTGRSPLYSGLRQMAFGIVTAGVTYGIGRLLGVAVS